MAIGHKSIVVEVVIPNRANPAVPFVIKVQANKNHGICDIIQGTKIPQEVAIYGKKKKTIMKFFANCRMTEVLSNFQGCQYDNPNVIEHLKNVLNGTFNKEVEL